jgi:hypothetical protein
MEVSDNFYIDSNGDIKRSILNTNISKFDEGIDKPMSVYKSFESLLELNDFVKKINANFNFSNKKFFKTFSLKSDNYGNFKSVKIYSDFIGNKNVGGLNWYITGYDIDSLKIIEEHYFFGTKSSVDDFLKINNLFFKTADYVDKSPFLYSIKYDNGKPIDFKTYFSNKEMVIANTFVNEIKRNLFLI